MRSRALLAVSGLLAAVAAGSAAAPEKSFRWQVAEGWQKETIPFPLEFAKNLPFSGVEEIRFAPGMFKPGEEGFWSHAFVW